VRNERGVAREAERFLSYLLNPQTISIFFKKLNNVSFVERNFRLFKVPKDGKNGSNGIDAPTLKINATTTNLIVCNK
jgi:hypothetical protein